MSTRTCIRLWTILALAGVVLPARAAEIEVLGAKAGAGSSLVARSGGVLEMRVLLPASLKASELGVELWQVADEVVLPLDARRAPAEATMATDARGVGTVRVAFPGVKRKTQVVARFFATQKPSEEIGNARVWVHPPVDWAPVARRLKENAPRLAVFGSGEELRAFLKLRGLAFLDLGDDVPEKAEPDVLAIGAVSAEVWRESKPRLAAEDGRMIVFVEGAAGLPGVYTTTSRAGALTQVTLPVVGGLADDPRAEDVFFQIIEQHLHSAPAAIF